MGKLCSESTQSNVLIVKANLSSPHRSVLTNLKIGILPLQLETGRWNDTPLQCRLRRVCSEGLLENGAQFLLQCEGLKEERSALFKELIDKTGYVTEGDSMELMKKMYTGNALKITGKHIMTMLERRKELLYGSLENEMRAEDS